MKITNTIIDDVIVIEPTHFEDERGYFTELFNASKGPLLFPKGVQQISYSKSRKGVLRGLHFQYEPLMAKALRVVKGHALIVNVDILPNSETFGQVAYVMCNDKNQKMVYAPGWIARGYYCLEDTEIEYFHSEPYNPETAITIAWNDPELNINWNCDVGKLILSEKDKTGMSLKEWNQTGLNKHLISLYHESQN